MQSPELRVAHAVYVRDPALIERLLQPLLQAPSGTHAEAGVSAPREADAWQQETTGAPAAPGLAPLEPLRAAAVGGPDHRLVQTNLQQDDFPTNQQNQEEQPPVSDQQPPLRGQEEPPLEQPQQPPFEFEGGGILGDVQIQALPDAGVIIISGSERDVQELLRIIEQIEQLNIAAETEILIVPLEHVGAARLTELLTTVYANLLAARGVSAEQQQATMIIPLEKPNALLIAAPRLAVEAIVGLVEELDQPVRPGTQFRVFRLQHIPAASLEQILTQFYTDRTGLGAELTLSADLRSNSIVVYASPRDLEEIGALVGYLDVPEAAAVNEVRIVALQHAIATDLATLITQAIQSSFTPGGLGAAGVPGAAPGVAPGAVGIGALGETGAAALQLFQPRSNVLRFVSIGPDGLTTVRSGVLTDIRVFAYPRTNALIVSAPAESVDLMLELIRELDVLPEAIAEIKVFTLSYGDAAAIAESLQQLLGEITDPEQPGGLGAPLPGTPAGETTIIPLRFTVDPRTNSIIAVGAPSDLRIVEGLLYRLDETGIHPRETRVIRLHNSPAQDVAAAISTFLDEQLAVEQAAAGLISPFEQLEREAIVVPEIITNSLLVSATQAYLPIVLELIEELDQDQPQVVIQVVLAEVTLGDTDEFGVELGLQDSVLFSRSVPQLFSGSPFFHSAETLDPGLNFNTADPLGDLAGTPNPDTIGTQGLSNFALGRMNGELGFGGLVFSAQSENVSVLLRALAQNRRLDVLSRPQVMTYNNQPAFIQVGQLVPLVRDVTTTQFGLVAQATPEQVGLILGVTPRISPDGVVVMDIDAIKSSLRPLEEGVPISTTEQGEVIRSPIIDITQAQTTVSARSGQTVVIGGLITTNDSHLERKVPWVGDLPLIGRLFRYDLDIEERAELLIILTPRVVRNEWEAEIIKQVEASRMSWVLDEVNEIHGNIGVSPRPPHAPPLEYPPEPMWFAPETMIVYPAGSAGPELVPLPDAAAPPPDSMAPPESYAPPGLYAPPSGAPGVEPQAAPAQPLPAAPLGPGVEPSVIVPREEFAPLP